MDGFLNLNKPAGWTSHDCVAKVRKLLKTKRVGHAGTLDPAAVGVLPIAVGRATRLLQYLRSDKAYRATIRFGITTATDDLEGETLTSQAVPDLTLEAIQRKLPLFLGVIQQIPPNYSAIQVDGKRLYDLARAGETIEAKPRTVEINSLEVLDWKPGDFPELDCAIACGSGTYIRSIARDLGAILNTGATLAHLIRTESSGFVLSDTHVLEDITSEIELTAPEQALQHLEKIKLEDAIALKWCQGQKMEISEIADLENEQHIRVFNHCDRFLGIGQRLEMRLVPRMVFEQNPL